MKYKAILLGVNVAASLPVVISQSAEAQNATAKSTEDFIRAGMSRQVSQPAPKLVAMKPSFILQSASQVGGATEKFSSAKAVQTRQSLGAGGVKLRPFVPGRKLPSRTELEAARMGHPSFDESQSRLAGTVEMGYGAAASDTYNSQGYGSYSQMDVARSTMRGKLQKAAQIAGQFESKVRSRVVPGQKLVSPGQVNQAVAPTGSPLPPGPSEDEWTEMAKSVGQKPGVNAGGDIGGDSSEFAELARQMKDMNGERAGAGNQSFTAGPPPFPLSLIPEASLKQFIGGKGGHASHGAPIAAAPSAPMASASRPPASHFGSWHGQSATPSAHHSNLQPSGFHSYLTAANSSRTSSAFKQYAPAQMRSGKRQAPRLGSKDKAVQYQGQAAVQKPATMAVYGEYSSSL